MIRNQDNINTLNEDISESYEVMIINNEDIVADININSINKKKENNKNNHIIRFMVNEDGSVDNLNSKINIDVTGEKKRKKCRKERIYRIKKS